jgi:hypothetical protein
MAKTRREKTLADYVVIALSPALIMTLVGSLAFFLLAVAYRGQFETRVQWVMFWFVLGAVLVARIAIEQGSDRVGALGWILAGLTALFVYKYVEDDAHIVAWTLLAVIWWCSWKLTWDCTLIDDSTDASGEGLIEAAGLVGESATAGPAAAVATVTDRSEPAAEGNLLDSRLPGWLRVLFNSGSHRGRPHAPGLWVVYFSLAALPLFGVGQLFIPATQEDRRTYAFGLLAVYVASALGLLLTTSFLGLRRYLRQRNLQMPGAMTATWIGMGTALAVGLLLLALLIPRPQGQYTVTEWIDKADAKAREASRLAVLRDGKGDGQGRPVGQQDPRAMQPGQQPPPLQRPNEQPGQPQNPQQNPNGQQPGQQGGEQQQQQAGAGQQPGGDKPGQQGDQQQQANAQGKQSGSGEKSGQGKGGDKQGEQGAGQQNQQANQQANQQGGQRGNQKPQQGQANQHGKQDPRQANGKQPQDGQQANGKQPDGKPNDGQQKPGEQPPPDQQAQPANPPAPAPPATSLMTSLLTTLAPLVKWILYGVLALIVLYVVFRNWARFIEMLVNLWNELLSLFGFGSRVEAAGGGSEPAAATEPPPPFSSFNDPFLDGSARRLNRVQLVRYTFEALEAWAREQGLPRSGEQTPLEFASELGQRVPKASKDVSETAQLYTRVAYARGNPTEESLAILERMWRRMNVMAQV